MAKRIRSTKARDNNFRDLHSSLVVAWRDSNRNHTPSQETFRRCSQRIENADVTVVDRGRLNDANWALREYSVMAHASWQLYLDGSPVTSDEVSAKRAAGDEDVWLRIKGRHEYAGSHDPYYSNDPPVFLHSSREHCNEVGLVHTEHHADS